MWCIDLEYLGVIYRDSMQDVALSSRLPIIVYKPQSIVSQAIFRMSDKILLSQEAQFENIDSIIQASYDNAENEAQEDFEAKLSYVEDLIGTGALSLSDLAETIKSQQFEINHLKKENNLLKSKILKAHEQGLII